MITKPSLESLGTDLLRTSLWERVRCLVLPFATCAGFFVAAVRGWWIAAVACAVAQSFFTYPLMTSYMPHDASAADPLRQTRLYRGRVVAWLACEHLYHLEHHLYPQVPHQRWPELARRLDPFFAQQGVEPIILWR